MLACHASQRNWLLRQHGIDEYLEMQAKWGSRRGPESVSRMRRRFASTAATRIPRIISSARCSGKAARATSCQPPVFVIDRAGHGVVDQLGDHAAQVAAVHDSIDETALAQELACLKPGGELHANGLFDDARAGETNQGLGLGQDEVAEPGETGGKVPSSDW